MLDYEEPERVVPRLFGEPLWIAMIEGKNDLHNHSYTTEELRSVCLSLVSDEEGVPDPEEDELGYALYREIESSSHEELVEAYSKLYEDSENLKQSFSDAWDWAEELSALRARYILQKPVMVQWAQDMVADNPDLVKEYIKFEMITLPKPSRY